MKKLLLTLLGVACLSLSASAVHPTKNDESAIVKPMGTCFRTNVSVCGGGRCWSYTSGWTCFQTPIYFERTTGEPTESTLSLTDADVDKDQQTMKLTFSEFSSDLNVVFSDNTSFNPESGWPSESGVTRVVILPGKYAIQGNTAIVKVAAN